MQPVCRAPQKIAPPANPAFKRLRGPPPFSLRVARGIASRRIEKCALRKKYFRHFFSAMSSTLHKRPIPSCPHTSNTSSHKRPAVSARWYQPSSGPMKFSIPRLHSATRCCVAACCPALTGKKFMMLESAARPATGRSFSNGNAAGRTPWRRWCRGLSTRRLHSGCWPGQSWL